MKIFVITVAAGRHDHLRQQLRGLRRSDRPADGHIVVAIDDAAIRDVCGPDACIVTCPRDDGRLPLARARNVGADRALAQGADLLVFLDVDCIPAKQLLDCYEHSARSVPPPALLSGPVTYLPPSPPDGYDIGAMEPEPHPARPMPAPGEVAELDHTLFWSLSFAVTADTWSQIGGFCELYRGYGAEDTDFALRARRAGVRHLAVGGAHAYHQWHPSGDPPLQHLEDIIRNGRTFQQQWGWWPMTGWLEKFRSLGLVAHDAHTDDWRVVVEHS